MDETDLASLLDCLEQLRSKLLKQSRFVFVVRNGVRFCTLSAEHEKVLVALNIVIGGQKSPAEMEVAQ